MTPDPLSPLSPSQAKGLGDTWYNSQPHYVDAYSLRKNKMQAVRDTLMLREWGTEDEPGPSLWVLRGLFGSMFRGGPRSAWIADALEGQGVLPTHVAHVFTEAWKRQNSLRELAVGATVLPEGDDARLFKQLLVTMPDLFRWTCTTPDKLKGPIPEGMIVEPYRSEDAPPLRSFNGEPFYSFLADLVKPKYQIAGWILDSVLNLDPFADYPAQTREMSLVEISVHYKSDTLRTYATQLMKEEGRLESQHVAARDRTYPDLMLRKGRYEELKASGVDIHYVDEKGLSYFHHLAASWLPVTFKNGQTYDKEPAEMEADFERVLAGWRTLVEMGGNPDFPCTPSQVLRKSKSGNRKGWPVGWKRNDALPGETALESLKRRATEGNGPLLSLELVLRLEACLRDDRAKKLTPAVKPSRPRQRS